MRWRNAAVVGGAFFLLFLGAVTVSHGGGKYPHVNVAISYEVDPKWPQRPTDVSWGAVPGIAVDAKDNVYVFTRAYPPVQVYDAAGKYLRGWGDKSMSAHHIRIDHEGYVWISDIANHVVEKYTP